MDWRAWHAKYDVPGSELSRRLAAVQEQVRAALDRAPAGPVPVVSLCAGQGRDLLEVIEDHPRGADVRARLVEVARHKGVAYADEGRVVEVVVLRKGTKSPSP